MFLMFSGRLFLCFMVYGAAMLPLNYIMTNVFSKPATGFVLMFFVNVLLGKNVLLRLAILILNNLLIPLLIFISVIGQIESEILHKLLFFFIVKSNLDILSSRGKILFNYFSGMMGSQIVDALFTPGLDTENVARILDYILQLVPLYGLVTAVR